MGRFNDRENYNNFERENFGREENNFDRMYDSRDYNENYSQNYNRQERDSRDYSNRATRPYSRGEDYPRRDYIYNEQKDPARPYAEMPRENRDNYGGDDYSRRDYSSYRRGGDYKSSMPNNYYDKYGHNYTPEECNRIKSANGGENQVVFSTPRSYEDIQKLIDSLKRKQSLIVDVNSIDPRDTQRYLDFLSGAIYALGGSYQKIDNKKFYFAPQGVSITIPYDLRQKKEEE